MLLFEEICSIVALTSTIFILIPYYIYVLINIDEEQSKIKNKKENIN